jgi:uncharacterized protein (TIRG00374 family)
VVLSLADPRRLLDALRLADYRFVVLSFGISFGWLVLRSALWRTLLQEKVSLKMTFFTVNEGYLLNNLLPFRLGELGRAFLLGRKAKLAFWQVFPTIVIERILDVAFAASLLLLTLPFVVNVPWARSAAAGAGALVLAGLATLYLLARNRERAMAIFARLGSRWPRLGRLAGDRLASFFDGLAVITDAKRFLYALGWMLLNWLVALAQYNIMLLAFFPESRFLWGAFSLGVAALGIAAPSSPGAVGVMELAIVGALAAFNLDPAKTLAFALAVHLVNYLLTGLLGAYGLAQDGESLFGIYRELTAPAHK